MVKKIVYCDRCKKQIDGDVIKIYAYLDDNDDYVFMDEEQRNRDYCHECVKKIMEFANGGNNQEENETEEEKPKKKKMDIGKIMALKKAGWSYEQIADEMHTTKASIASTIYQYKKKMQKEGE